MVATSNLGSGNGHWTNHFQELYNVIPSPKIAHVYWLRQENAGTIDLSFHQLSAGVITFSCTFVPVALYAAWQLLDARRHVDGALAEQEEMALQGLVQLRLGSFWIIRMYVFIEFYMSILDIHITWTYTFFNIYIYIYIYLCVCVYTCIYILYRYM